MISLIVENPMSELSREVSEGLGYFTTDAIERYPPASDEMIASAEQRLGLVFPPSLHEFLQVHNGIRLIDAHLLGVPTVGADGGIVEETQYWREAPWRRNGYLVVGRKATGDVYALLTGYTDENGEVPVAQIDHETGEIMFIVGSNYERFAWFLLDRLRREFEPDGEDKGLWEAPEDEDEEWEEPSFPWPYEDKDWMKQQDPGLARWLYLKR